MNLRINPQYLYKRTTKREGLYALGTFLSVRFGDELLDVISHKDRDFFQTQ